MAGVALAPVPPSQPKPLLIAQGDMTAVVLGDRLRVTDELIQKTADYLQPIGISVAGYERPPWMRVKDTIQVRVEPILYGTDQGVLGRTGSSVYSGQPNRDVMTSVVVQINSLPNQPDLSVDHFARCIAHEVGWHCLDMTPYHTPGTEYLSCDPPGDKWSPQYLTEQRRRSVDWGNRMVNDGHPGNRPRHIPNSLAMVWRSRFRQPSPPVLVP